MKQRFSSLDVKVIAHELHETLVGLRLSNIYDLSSKIFLVKFAKPDNKKQIVIDTGFRCHLTDFVRSTAAAPSAFVARLRKSLRTRRLTSVSQVGTDRILEFQFSDGQYRLFLEFFASGNIILTDADLKILALSRNVPEGEAQEPQGVGLIYSLEKRQNYLGIPPLTKERVKEALQAAVDKAAAGAAGSARKGKTKPGGDLRKSLALSIVEIPPVLVDHVLQENNFDTAQKPVNVLASDDLLDELLVSLIQARKIVEEITSVPECAGFIFAKTRQEADASKPEGERHSRENLLYEDFHPFLPKKLKEDSSLEVLEFKGFNKTVDEFFSSLEGQKVESRLTEREAAAKRKLDAAKQDQEKRIEGLQEAQELNLRKAAAIEANVERVQEAIDAVNGLIAQGMDWVDIGKLIEREKKRQNPVANLVKLPLRLSENIVTLVLAEEEFEKDEEEDPFETDESDDSDVEDDQKATKVKQAKQGLNIDIDLTASPWSNAREYYEQRRTAAVKTEKTQAQAVRALKNAEQKINDDLKKGLKQEKALLQPVRRQMWFEKFHWFISSDGYLVIGGKDAQQTEIIYKKNLRKGDIYCHAELRGAASVIIKNNPGTPDAPIPPSTLTQAGALSVCTSDAWDSKAGMGAWWVNADQVSKSASTGEYLAPGSFTINGKKNYLPPTQLLLGLGLVFKISDKSKARHIKHRLGSDQPPSISEAPMSAADLDQSEEEHQADDGNTHESSNDDENTANDETDEEFVADEPRDNPLQLRQNRDGMESEEEIEEGISNLKVSNDDGKNKEPHDEPDQEKSEDDEDDEDEDADEEDSLSVTEASAVPSSTAPAATTNSTGVDSTKTVPPKRGQRRKARKIANKYKDQDEEDRIAAEALIGAKAGQDRADMEAKAKADQAAEMAAAKERRRAQHQKQQRDIAEHEEIRKAMMDDDVDVPDANEVENMASLDSLVGLPLSGDEILEAIPICAPWTALGKFKYKVKLQPGSMKKGKAVKEILERWKMAATRKGVVDEASLDKEKMWPKEVELMKAMKPEDVHNAVPVGKVRVMIAGGGSGGGSGNAKKGRGGKSGKGGKGGKR